MYEWVIWSKHIEVHLVESTGFIFVLLLRVHPIYQISIHHARTLTGPPLAGSCGLGADIFAKQEFCSLHPQTVGIVDGMLHMLGPLEQSTVLSATVCLTHSFLTAGTLFPFPSTPAPQHSGIEIILQSDDWLQL